MTSTVHSIEAIQALLRRGHMPKTDNRDALVALGFVRARLAAGEDMWERSVDHPLRAPNGQKVMVRERAVLEETPLGSPDNDERDTADRPASAA